MLSTACIVLYKNEPELLRKAIYSFLKHDFDGTLYLVDNSPTDRFKNLIIDDKVIYIHNPSNPGFGAAHNIAINLALTAGSKYHFVVNPDTYFEGDIITPMIEYMEQNSDVGMMMPQILNSDGSIQYLPKLLPSLLTIVKRKIKFPRSFHEKFLNNYELRFVADNMIYEAPIISGCFTLLNLNAIKELGGYDDRFFMYFEDWDLSRRINKSYKTIYFPKVSVYHDYHSGANKSFKLFKIFLKSAYHYFNKWGWFFDKKRKEINKNSLAQFK